MATKAEQIIDHFTQDPVLKTRILNQIAEIKGHPDPQNIDKIIACCTDDPALAAKIKEIIGKVGDGHTMNALTGYHIADATTAARASEAISRHRGAVEQILSSSTS